MVRNKSSVTNLNTLAHINLLAVVVSAITTQSGQSYRQLKAVRRTALFKVNLQCLIFVSSGLTLALLCLKICSFHFMV